MHPTQILASEPTEAADATTLDGVTPSDCLRGAALYLQRHGWHQGRFFATEDIFPAASADGALIMAVYGHRVDVFDVANAPLLDGEAYHLWLAALDAVEDHLGLRRAFIPAQHIIAPGDLLFAWQDDPTRTRDDVITALNDAADDWDQQQARLAAAVAISTKHPSEWTDADVADWRLDVENEPDFAGLGDEPVEDTHTVVPLGYGCRTCGPDEYCPDDAMERCWDNYTGDEEVLSTGGAA
ncbi:hypothetical protein ACFFX1_11855 [Dactylosporangium sucinum]|uniref:Uncharacterized protein n=1 Tax=Dactylosporangium sucinum TaxID=1424081 RepID=A0A917TLA8_9ACTN|nr:hypothetical protein [Dactylosporangium sucinum]GGM27718.1 hypothetical protein GCM10007977_031190 [Dactylosporangium sucinum]